MAGLEDKEALEMSLRLMLDQPELTSLTEEYLRSRVGQEASRQQLGKLRGADKAKVRAGLEESLARFSGRVEFFKLAGDAIAYLIASQAVSKEVAASAGRSLVRLGMAWDACGPIGRAAITRMAGRIHYTACRLPFVAPSAGLSSRQVSDRILLAVLYEADSLSYASQAKGPSLHRAASRHPSGRIPPPFAPIGRDPSAHPRPPGGESHAPAPRAGAPRKPSARAKASKKGGV